MELLCIQICVLYIIPKKCAHNSLIMYPVVQHVLSKLQPYIVIRDLISIMISTIQSILSYQRSHLHYHIRDLILIFISWIWTIHVLSVVTVWALWAGRIVHSSMRSLQYHCLELRWASIQLTWMHFIWGFHIYTNEVCSHWNIQAHVFVNIRNSNCEVDYYTIHLSYIC